MANTHQVKIGVLMSDFVQFLDTACVDIFASASREYLAPFAGEQLGNQAPSVTINYISTKDTVSGETPTLLTLSASAQLMATHGLRDAGVQPGELDILLIPGPDPRLVCSEETLEFVRGHSRSANTDIISVCTGVIVCGQAGIIDGKEACGPRAMQGMLRAKFPKAKFVGDEYRWKQDGNFWSGGAITNGNDVVAAYMLAGKHFPEFIAKLALTNCDIGERPQKYQEPLVDHGVSLGV